MVKNIIRVILYAIISFYFLSCTIDFLGLFYSSDLDDRLKEKDNFVLLNGVKKSGESRNWKNLNLGNNNEYSFIVITDTHIQDNNGGKFTKEKENKLRNLKNVISNNDVKFAVHLGDITQSGNAQEIDLFIEIADSLGVPFYPVIGNHDIYFGNFNNEWKNKIGSTRYRIDGNGSNSSVTLFFMDSANSFFGNDQLDWLERELKYTNETVFVFTHAPLFVKGPVDMQQISDTNERARIVSMLRNKCKIMFMGHLHKDMENVIGNVIYKGAAAFIDDDAYYLVKMNGKNVVSCELKQLN